MARHFSVLALLAFALLSVLAVPAPVAQDTDIAPPAAPPKPKTCSKVGLRKEWRTLSKKERKAYLDAVVCLQNKPGTYKNIYGIDQLTAHEDFVYQHKNNSPYVHYNGIFLAWHRYFLHTYETRLKKECGYKGMMPYWDQTLDVYDTRKSPIYDAETGFGGNGEKLDPLPPPPNPGVEFLEDLMFKAGANQSQEVKDRLPITTGGGCVTDGPFAKDKYVLRIARYDEPKRDDHCLERDLSPLTSADWSTKQRERDLYKLEKYSDFHYLLEGTLGEPDSFFGVHAAGHTSYGGIAGDPYASPNDPIFFMHHNNIDRIWRQWQKTDLNSRLYQLGYPWFPIIPVLRPDPAVAASISNATTVTLDFPITLMGKLAPTRLVNELMDTRAGFLCYDFE